MGIELKVVAINPKKSHTKVMENQPITNPSDASSVNIIPVNQSPLPPQKKANLIVPILLTLVISAVIFSLGGYYFGKQTLSSSQLSNSQQVFSGTPPASTKPSDLLSPTPPDSTVGWRTYTNSDPAYTIKYPEDWKVDSAKAKVDPQIGGELAISKGGYKLTISWPSAYGPSGCVFEDQPEYKNFESDPMPSFSLCTGEFRQFMGETNTFRRLIAPRTDTTTPVWNIYTKEKSSNSFVTVPPITYTAAKNYELKEIEVMDSILSTFQAN